MAYRKAKCIELHEAGTVITLSAEEYASTAPAARHAQASRPALSIRLAEIDRLAERFGLRPRAVARDVVEARQAALEVLRDYFEFPADAPGVTITSLECDVLGPNLVDIRVETRQEGDRPEVPGAVEMITHSGAFTIWWAADQPASAQELFAVAEAHPTIPLEAGVPAPVEDEVPDVGVLPPKIDQGTT